MSLSVLLNTNKKILLSAVFVYISVCSALAQNPVKIDSLLQLLTTKITDKEKVDIYNNIALQYSSTDSTKTIDYANRAIHLSKQLNYIEGISNAHNSISQATVKLAHSDKASDLFQKIKYAKGKAIASNDLALTYKKKGEYAMALKHFTKVLKIRDSLGNKKDVAFCYSNIGQVHVRLGNYTKALDYNSKALELFKELNNKNGIFSGYNNIGMINVYQSNYSSALEYFIKASKINDEIGSKKKAIVSLSNIGFIYETLGDYDLALEYYFKCLTISKSTKNQASISEDYLNIGNIYFEQEDDAKALTYSFKSLKIAKKLNIKGIMISNYCLIGEIYLNEKNYKEALKYLKNGLTLSQEIGELSSSTTVMNTLGEIEFELKNYLQAKEYLIKSITIGQEIGFPSAVKSASYGLVKIEKALGNHKAALESYERYHAIYDSILGEEKSKQLSQLQVQYETEKKEQEIKSLAQQASIQSLELKQANFNKTIFGIASVVLLLLGLVLYLVNRQKRLALQQRAQDIEQNLLRVQMNPHFIFNAMTSIQDYMNQGDAKQASMYLIKFSKLIRQVLDNSRSEFISLDQEINMLDNYLSIQNLKRDHPFTFKIEVEDGLIPEEIAIPPMFAQPFVENAIEHGVTAIKEGATIHIHFSMEGDHLALKILDNGSGIEEAIKVKRKDHVSHAIKITEERIDLYRKMRKKKIAFDIKNLSQGTQVTFNLPFQHV
ncbi:tetratricopeptide (TPR) repeat protein [Aquimarina sp. EL_43]|uniref:tetratricopeptide repeat protein n=1 Tax=unclassified Aquimarina TaxID=2627091 RepID=UPI0018CA0E26|nr:MULTISPECIES: tetratricopeptide repeat protein [unclassified Aquimarina]MBG6132534.1 tetratricopeptide (TPR) repeat protein [Aquimarina sp. EL_35]MBG6152665.1 tetratricopeptide (TPR) repeat protein [Aquimarina sp. EL_32]MBG6170672.1 tetratricopeptide (TPR) repeat protein [Aquimarina sp. EL_43]